MPELPEVEITRRGLVPHLVGRRVDTVLVRNRNLRWPIARDLGARISGCTVRTVERRAKYLLIGCGSGWLIVHLGMSGSLRVLPRMTPVGKHDHFDLVLDSGMVVRLTDPRRFGAVLWAAQDPHAHPCWRTLRRNRWARSSMAAGCTPAPAAAARQSRPYSWIAIPW